MKLYRSHRHPTRWYAFQPGTGFVMFPAEAGGWEKRQQARGFDPIDVREVPSAWLMTPAFPSRHRRRRNSIPA